MGTQGLALAPASVQHAIIQLPSRCTVAYYERELEVVKLRLRQALARERALLEQWDELMQLRDDAREPSASHDVAASRIAALTLRQRQIMKLVLAGHPNKNIAADLNINMRTVENHRARIMKRTGSKSLPALTQLALAAGWNLGDKTFVPTRLDA
jgi:DNA-binding NarL/FixJ family response regulator